MFYLKTHKLQVQLAKSRYLDACRNDKRSEAKAKEECKKLLVSPKGLGAIAGVGLLRGLSNKSMSKKRASMVLGRRLLSAWLGGVAAASPDQVEQVPSGITDTQ